VATFLTLLRSVALDRWITVAATVVLLVATAALGRGRTWGVALSLLMGAMLFGVWALGIAPAWFAFLGLLAAAPFVSLARDFARFDRSATAWLSALAVGLGSLGAAAWKGGALALFRAVPLLAPSVYPHHGLVVAALAATAAALALRGRTRADAVGIRTRVAAIGPRVVSADHEARSEDLAEEDAARKASASSKQA